MRALATLALLCVAPASAQEFLGRCIGADRWSAGTGYASFEDCDGGGDDPMLILSCNGGATRISVILSVGYVGGERMPVHSSLLLDGAVFALIGRSEFDHHHDSYVLVDAPIPPDAVEALASGRAGVIVTPDTTYPIHLTDSRGAIETMRSTCR